MLVSGQFKPGDRLPTVRQLAVAQVLPNLTLGTNYDSHRGVLQQASGNILNTNRDALYVGMGANAVGSGSPGVPGLSLPVSRHPTTTGIS